MPSAADHHHHGRVFDGGHSHDPTPGAARFAFVANSVLLVAQVVGGLLAHSLALVGDAAHQATDVLSLGVVVVGLRFRSRPAPTRLSFGRRRTEAVIAQGSAVVLVIASTWIAIEAIDRLGDTDRSVNGWLVIVLASLGVIVNGSSALAMFRADHTSLLSRSAILHLTADAVGSLAVLVVGVVITAGGSVQIDPIVSLGLAVLIIWGALRLGRDATLLLLDAIPAHLDVAAVEQSLVAHPAVSAAHHLHLWQIDDRQTALSAHVVTTAVTVGDAQRVLDELTELLGREHGIDHVTLQPESLPCADLTHRHESERQ